MPLASLLFHDVYVTNPAESGFTGPGADRYKLSLAEFEGALAAIATMRHEAPLVSVPRGRETDAFALTVDDGGVSYATVIADRLEARGWRGLCFVATGAIGRRGFVDRGQLRELDARGHAIGSHSVSHPPRFSACSFEKMRREWQESREALEDALGRAVTMASLPGGYLSRRGVRAAAEAGITVLFTSEPVGRPSVVEGCLLVGRLTIRPGFSAERIAALAAFRPAAVWRERAVWTAKKAIKPLLGPIYPRLAGGRRQPSHSLVP